MNKNICLKVLIKIATISFICLMIVCLFINDTFAIIDVNSMKPTISPPNPTVLSKGQKILGAVQTVGSIVSVAVLTVIGIKFVMGSAEEKAEYKKMMIPYIIGAVILFAASNLVQMVYEVVNKIN